MLYKRFIVIVIAEKSDSYWMVSNKDVDGKQLNEDGAWGIDGIVQTISERRDVKGNSEKCGLTPGLYWDRNHEGRIEIATGFFLMKNR